MWKFQKKNTLPFFPIYAWIQVAQLPDLVCVVWKIKYFFSFKFLEYFRFYIELLIFLDEILQLYQQIYLFFQRKFFAYFFQIFVEICNDLFCYFLLKILSRANFRTSYYFCSIWRQPKITLVIIFAIKSTKNNKFWFLPKTDFFSVDPRYGPYQFGKLPSLYTHR